MLVLDTNVLSALILVEIPPPVAAWMRRQALSQLYTTAVCQAEMLAGVAALPAGRRRSDLGAWVTHLFGSQFAGRVLAFDPRAAEAYGEVYALRRRAERPSAMADLMIASIARVHGATVATRNLADFEACGVELVDPWTG